VSAGEPERVADVNDDAAFLGRDETELASARRADLKTPLLGKEKGQRADVGVFLVANVLVMFGIGGDIMHHGKGGGGRTVVSVPVLKTILTRKAETGGQGR